MEIVKNELQDIVLICLNNFVHTGKIPRLVNCPDSAGAASCFFLQKLMCHSYALKLTGIFK